MRAPNSCQLVTVNTTEVTGSQFSCVLPGACECGCFLCRQRDSLASKSRKDKSLVRARGQGEVTRDKRHSAQDVRVLRAGLWWKRVLLLAPGLVSKVVDSRNVCKLIGNKRKGCSRNGQRQLHRHQHATAVMDSSISA